MTLFDVPAVGDSYPNQDQTDDPVETRVSHHLSRCPEEPGQTCGPAAAAETQPCSMGEARSDRDGRGRGAPGAAPSQLTADRFWELPDGSFACAERVEAQITRVWREADGRVVWGQTFGCGGTAEDHEVQVAAVVAELTAHPGDFIRWWLR